MILESPIDVVLTNIGEIIIELCLGGEYVRRGTL